MVPFGKALIVVDQVTEAAGYLYLPLEQKQQQFEIEMANLAEDRVFP